MNYIVLFGNIIDGFSFFGPFETGWEATEFAKKQGKEDWRVVSLFDPTCVKVK